MLWLKLRVSLRHNRAFLRLSKNAKLAFFGALMAVAEYEQGGALTMRQGPLTDTEIADDLLLSKRESKLAVRELEHAGFFQRDENGVIFIAKFQEKTESSSAARMRRLREKERLEAALRDVTEAVTVTAQLRHSDGHSDASPVTTEEEREEEKERESLRDGARGEAKKSLAYEFCTWLLAEGIKAGAVAAHHGIDPHKWCYPQTEVAETLIATYGADEGRVRAQRFIAEKVAQPPRIRKPLTVQALLDVWDWEVIRGAAVQRNGASKPVPALSPATQATIDRLRAREGR